MSHDNSPRSTPNDAPTAIDVPASAGAAPSTPPTPNAASTATGPPASAESKRKIPPSTSSDHPTAKAGPASAGDEEKPTLGSLDPGGEPHDAAQKVLAKLGVRGERMEILLPAVAMYYATHRRADVRSMERAAFRQRIPAPDALRDAIAAEQENDMLALLTQPFRLYKDGPLVMWGEATAEDHRARIAALETLVGQVQATIERHQKAIGLLEDSGAKTLNELYLKSAAA